jgi:type I restriction enzyme M protein
MFAQAFKNMDDVLWKDAGCTTKLDYTEQTSFVALQKTFADSPKSWSLDVSHIDPTTFDLSVKNPNAGEEITHCSPQAIIDEMAAWDAERAQVLGQIRGLL